MGKLTRKQRAEIEGALAALNRLIRLIESDRIAFCNVGTINALVPQGIEFRNGRIIETKEYKGRDDKPYKIDFVQTLYPMDKGIGSDLVARYDVKRALERLLEA
jgi:hypothetical protein